MVRTKRTQSCVLSGAREAKKAAETERSSAVANRVLTPKYWSTVGNVNFNFTGLEQQGPLDDFQWGLGTTPGGLNTVPYQSIAGSSLRFNSFTFNTLVCDPPASVACRNLPPRALDETRAVQYGQDVYIDGDEFSNQTVYTLNYTLPGQSLLDGTSYYVTVQLTGDDPLTATSTAVTVTPGPFRCQLNLRHSIMPNGSQLTAPRACRWPQGCQSWSRKATSSTQRIARWQTVRGIHSSSGRQPWILLSQHYQRTFAVARITTCCCLQGMLGSLRRPGRTHHHLLCPGVPVRG